MYSELVTALKALTAISFAEYGWSTRPSTDFGVVALDGEHSAVLGDDKRQEVAFEGTVDAFLHAPSSTTIAAVEAVLTQICDGSWHLNSIQYEDTTKLLHYEWVFRLEAM